MPVRPARRDELPKVVDMMRALTSEEYDFGDEIVFVWEREDGSLGGFVSLSLRPWAEGRESEPAPYIEGWWVDADIRRAGVGSALIRAAEEWCRTNGYAELGSDADVENEISIRAHRAVGFEPTLRLQFFRRRL